MLKKLIRLGEHSSKKQLLALSVFPLTLIFANFIRLLESLLASRILGNGQWSEFNRFRSLDGVNSLFYWTQALNFDRFGRHGKSPNVGTGNYHLGNWWFSSLTALYLYWRLGAVLPLLSAFVWLISHVFWFGHPGVDSKVLVAALFFVLVSSYFYAGAFVFLNYNALGWLFMPVGLYGLITDNYWVASFAWLGASLGSITVVFIAGLLSITWAAYQGSHWPLFALLPSIVKLATHLAYVPDLKDSFLRVVYSLGLNNFKNTSVKYKRSSKGVLISTPSLYFVATWGIFIWTLIYLHAIGPALLASTVLLIWIVNSSITRFADDQSLYMAMFSVATASLIVTPNILVLCAYWLGVSPPPFIVGAGNINDSLIKPRSYTPFKVQGLIDRCHQFLSEVPSGSRIILALEDPKGEYNKLFDGNRVTYELLFYVGNLREILSFPDWWAVFENNTTSSPDFWGKTPEMVMKNAKNWNADHVLICQDTATPLEDCWRKAGFIEKSKMDWGELLMTHLNGEPCWGSDRTAPKWFLLKAPKLA